MNVIGFHWNVFEFVRDQCLNIDADRPYLYNAKRSVDCQYFLQHRRAITLCIIKSFSQYFDEIYFTGSLLNM